MINTNLSFIDALYQNADATGVILPHARKLKHWMALSNKVIFDCCEQKHVVAGIQGVYKARRDDVGQARRCGCRRAACESLLCGGSGADEPPRRRLLRTGAAGDLR